MNNQSSFQNTPEDVLRHVFHHRGFRPGQKTLIDAVLSGRDTIGILPTGAGKSLCYQLPALLRPGLTIVISPLIALMTDQVNVLKSKGIAAEALNSSLSASRKKAVLNRVRRGELCLLYLSPERFVTPEFQSFLTGISVSLVCVDEAHCLSAWGDDFRPSYRRIGEVLGQWPGAAERPPVCALTASATPEVRADIAESLGLVDPFTEILSFDRPNLFFGILNTKDKLGCLVRILPDYRQKCGIIYCQTRQSVTALARFLNREGFPAAAYHAGLTKKERDSAQAAWMSGRLPTMVATNAFGMGIDKKDVRYVIHFQMPGSMECYYQEAGRAGRDGEAADCLILSSLTDIRIHDMFLRLSASQKRRLKKNTAALHTMMAYTGGQRCLRAYILDCFGEKPAAENCGFCSVCLEKSARPPRDILIKASPGKDSESRDLSLNGDSGELYLHLLSLRSCLLKQKKRPLLKRPLIPLFPDMILKEMAALRPLTWLDFLLLPDISLLSALRYGRRFLQEIRIWQASRTLL